MHRAPRTIALALAVALAAAACGGGGSDGDDAAAPEAAVPEACTTPPVTMDLRSGGDAPAGSDTFEVTDAVARRVAILPGQMAFDPSALSTLEAEAKVTPLALYSLYLADFEIDRSLLSGVGFGEVPTEAGQTLGVLTLVPDTEAGFRAGDVVADGELGYELTTSLVPLSLAVYGDGDDTGIAYTEVEGQAEILALDDDSICIEVDVTLSTGDDLAYAASGTVQAPVVRAADAFFFT